MELLGYLKVILLIGINLVEFSRTKENQTRWRGSRILKWGVNFCNNVIEPKPG